MSTLYEMFPKGGSYNHAWNGSNKILSKYIAGVEPTKVGWSEFQILPNLVHFKRFKKVIPTVKGKITIDLQVKDNSYQLVLKSPDNSLATIGVPKTGKIINEVVVNGKVVWKKGRNKKKLNGFDFDNENEKFLKFKVQAGTWEVNATYN